MVDRVFDRRRLQKMGIGAIQERVNALEQQIGAMESALDKVESTGFLWLVNEYLPAERRRIEVDRSVIAPDDGIKQAMAQGQINEIGLIQEELPALRSRRDELTALLKLAREAEANWYKRNGKKQGVA